MYLVPRADNGCGMITTVHCWAAPATNSRVCIIIALQDGGLKRHVKLLSIYFRVVPQIRVFKTQVM